MLEALILFNVLAHVASSATCTGDDPLQLPVTNVLLSNGETIRGIWTAVGTPAQNISLFPKVFLNDTWIYNTTSPFCDAIATNATATECTTLRGGLYNPDSSTTAVKKADVLAAGADASDTVYSREGGTVHTWSNDWVQDSFHLGNVTLSKYPVGMPGMDITTHWVTMASLGLSSNSTILTALKAAGRITSRSYSWWYGVESGPNQKDGSIIFGGGYAKTTDPQLSLPINPSTITCPGGMSVMVTDLQLNFKNGTNATIMDGKPAFTACLEPDWSTVMSFDVEYFVTFSTMTQTFLMGRENNPGFTKGGLLYSPNNVYDGGLTITLNDKFNVEIPNDILVTSPQYVANDGSIQTNDSIRELLVNPLVGAPAGTIPYIGKQFFSQTYLTVDFDTSKFTLSQASANGAGDLVRIGKSCTPTLSRGYIAGIAVGVVVAIAAVIAGVSVIARRRRQPTETHPKITKDQISRPRRNFSRPRTFISSYMNARQSYFRQPREMSYYNQQ